MKPYFWPKRLALTIAVCLLAASLLALAACAPLPFPAVEQALQSIETGRATSVGPERAVRNAWERTRDIGVYRFATELEQTTYPAPAVANAGRSPQQNLLYLEGEVNLPQDTLRLGLWQPGDGNLAASPGAEVRVEGDRAYLRRSGGDWQEAPDFTGGFAPGNDPLAYLAGMKNVVELGTETRELGDAETRGRGDTETGSSRVSTSPPHRVSFTRYGFDLNGPAFAAYARDQLERQLAERGELPFGVTLDMAREFREMQGQGELWVDGQGLPLRLSMHLVYPQTARGERIEADIRTDFSGFPAQAVAATMSLRGAPFAVARNEAKQSPPMEGIASAQTTGLAMTMRRLFPGQDPVAWVSHSLRLRWPSARDWQKAGRAAAPAASAAAVALGLALLIVAGRRSRRVYAAVTLAVIFSMVIVPLLQDARILAFSERLAARQAQQQAGQAEEQAARDMAAELRSSSWDAHLDPLAGAAPPVQPAGAGQPAPRLPATTPTPTPVVDPCGQMTEADDDADGVNNYWECVLETDPNAADSDADGLTDGQEVNRLGTDPLGKDTDGDGIIDYVEVAGFDYAGQHWYTDPKNPDTNNDGLFDTVECRLLTGVSSVPAITAECDQDDDSTPDLFDNDDDNDGVPDRVDISPVGVVGRAGKAATPAGISYFDADHPFQLSLQNLAANQPTFVDLQMRPQNADHLTYALNVLDWPAGDADGQIQHGRNSTFATTSNVAAQNSADPANYNGDMRLIPLLEIQIDGASVPLKLANLPVVNVAVGAGTAVSTTVSLRQSDQLTSRLDFGYAAPGSYTVDLYRGACPVSGSPLHTFTGASAMIAGKLVNLADGDHALRVTKGADAACADLPNLVNGPYTYNVIDTSVLEPYGITVREVSINSTTLLAYVPLNLAPDDTGGGRVAFSARMLYWPGASNTWAQAQAFRVVWAVQMLTDECDPPTEPLPNDQNMTTWCAQAAHRTADQLQIVQTYDESWYVSGLAVREDHGLDVAIAYENTGKPDADLEHQDALWMLSLGLGSSFVPQRDCEDATSANDPDYDPGVQTCHSDNLTDLAIFTTDWAGNTVANATIASRWDSADRNHDNLPDNWQATEEQRLAIPADELLVESYRYPHQDYHAYIAMTHVPAILQRFPTTAIPTLLFAHAEHYRGAGLETAQGGTGPLTLNLDPATYAEQTLTTLNWAPYRYNTSSHSWESYPANEYWDQLELTLKARFMQLYPDDGEDAAVGRMVVARGYYVSLLQGVGGSCTEKPCKVIGYKDSPKDLINASKLLVAKGLTGTVKLVIQGLTKLPQLKVVQLPSDLIGNEWRFEDATITEYRYTAASLGQAFKTYFAGPWKNMFSLHNARGYAGMIGAGVLLAGAAAAIALAFTQLATPLHGAVHIAARVLLGLNVLLTSYALVHTISGIVKSAVKLTQAMSSLRTSMASFLSTSLKAGTTKAGMVGLVIGIVVTWAAFGVSWGVLGLSAGSMAWNRSLAASIGATIGIIVLFVILTALGPLGGLIGAIMGAIDSMVAMICNAFLSAEQQASAAGQWLCGGISGLVGKFFSWVLYSGTIMVDLEPKKEKGPPWYPRLAFSDFGLDPVDPAGLVAGKQVKYGISVTNTIDLAAVPVQPQEVVWWFQFNDSELRTATFNYRWQASRGAFHEGLSRKTMADAWQETGGERPFYIATPVQSDGIALPITGINQPVTLYLSEAYAVPAQECWTIPVSILPLILVPICYIRTEKATQHYDIGSELKLDILPATLDGFYSLVAKGGGYALSWGQTGALAFPTLLDADGDGLAAAADPNDSRWDADGDTLRDGYELSIGSNPSSRDSDGDGLTDADEARLGTNPGLPDSDGDGLRDADEVAGWPFVVAVKPDGSAFTTHVSSNPLDVDEDGDGLTDFQEQTYGLNPLVPSDPNVLTLQSEISEILAGSVYTPADNLVAPGASLHYTATVTNHLDNRYAQGLLSTESPGVLQNQGVPQSFVLYPGQQQVMAGNVSVSQAAASGVYSLTQVAGALITDWSERAGGATLWLPFDESAIATTWADRSGNHPPHDATCVGSGCATEPTGGRYGGAMSLAKGAGYPRSAIGVSQANYGVSFWFKNRGNQSDAALFSADDPHGVQVYLSQWQVCAKVAYQGQSGYAWESICDSRTLQDGDWHHVAHTYSAAGGQQLYVDGVLAGSGQRGGAQSPATNAVNIGSSQAGIAKFTGLIDDVRLYDRVLSLADVETLANLPVLNVNFDSDTGWVDSSGFGAAISCASCPSHLAGGISGRAASFNNTQYLEVHNDGQLDLSDSPFTLAAWVKPQNQGNADDSAPQGILGLASGESFGYPALQRVGDKIRFGFSANSQFRAKLFNTAGLTIDGWNHVAVTFDPATGTVKLYVNGILKEEDASTFQGLKPDFWPPGYHIDIGRSSSLARFTLNEVHVTNDGDGIEDKGEMCMSFNGEEIFNQTVDAPQDFYPNVVKAFYGDATLRVWENDGGLCGGGPDDGDDVATITDQGVAYTNGEVFHITDPGDGVARTLSYKASDDSEGTFKITYANDSIPFYGAIDEVQIHKQALDEAGILGLVLAGATAWYLPLDEPPGATTFKEPSLRGRQATCTTCPTSGLWGRINQGAWFDSAAGSRLSLGNSDINQLTNRLAVAAWIKPHTLSGHRRIVASARTHSANGWGFGTKDADLVFTTFGVKDYVLTGVGLETDRWYHVAAVMDANNAVSFYVDGQLRGAVTGAALAVADSDDVLLVGTTTASGSTTLSDTFDGLIDELWVFKTPLQASAIQRLYSQAPVMHLRLDEAREATYFADAARPDRFATCTGAACPLTGEGVTGQLGLAAQFDAQDDLIELAHSAALVPATFSVGAWVKPTDIKDYRQELIGKWSGGNQTYRLALDPSTLLVRFNGGCATLTGILSSSPLIKDHWNHVMGTYDGHTLRIFVNGSQSASAQVGAGTCTNTAPVRIGGYDQKITSTYAGQLDEIVLYDHALIASQIHDLYLYQGGWVQDRESRNLTVDAEAPTVELHVPGMSVGGGLYLANQPVQLVATGRDATTDVAAAALGIQKYNGSLAWGAAPRCVDPNATAAWCPTFTPSGDGRYALRARATDQVGHSAESSQQFVFVDDTPPALTLSPAEGVRVDAVRDVTGENRWLVPLAGTVSDPKLASGEAGSGVPADGVRVTLSKPNGDVVGLAGQPASIASGAWWLNYVFADVRPTGVYTVRVEAVDAIGQTPGLSATQMGRHSTTLERRIVVHAAAPSAQTDRGQSPATSGTVQGWVTARPVPVEVNWTTGANGAQEGLAIACSAPVSATVYTATSGTFAASDSYAWEGSIHKDATCKVTLAVSAGSGDMTGTVKVCGTQVATWPAGYADGRAVSFTATAAACPVDLPTAGIDAVDLAFTPNLPGSPFLNEAPASGLALHLPFEDSPDQQGNLSFRDVSGKNRTGTCNGQACPSAGQAGHIGSAALFDGVNDAVKPASFSGFNTTTVSAWVRRTGATTARETIVSYKEAVRCGFVLALNNEDQHLQYPRFWAMVAATGGATDWRDIYDAHPVPLDTWMHLAGTYDGQVMRLYRDGQEVASSAIAGTMVNCAGGVSVGAYPNLDRHFFPGLIDDVRIYDHALTAAEIKTLYLGSAPLLELGFEKPSMTHATVLPDSSGWGHNGTLQTGGSDTLNRAVAGKVGAYALEFGGDDYVSAGDLNETDGFGDFALTQWFSLNVLGTASSAQDWATSVGKGAFSGNGWAVLVNRDSANAGNHKINLYFNGAVAVTTPAPSGGWQTGRWYHYAFTRSGNTLKGYLDGVEKVSVSNSTVPAANSSSVLVGKNETRYFWQGKLDDVRIYPRGLSAAEVQSLYRSGWQDTTLTQHGPTVQVTKWQGQAPAGLEGSFRLDLRPRDTADHSEAVSERAALWSGSLDTLVPRVTLYRTAAGASYRYTTVATDFNLVTSGFASPCGSTAAATYFQSPWYVALASSSPKLYQLTADCTLAARPGTEQATACDTFGNCATVGVTASSTLAAEEGLEPAAAAVSELLARPEVQRWSALRRPDLARAAADQLPAISLPTVLTATHYTEPSTIDVTGLITGSQAVTGVQVAIGAAGGSAYLSIPEPDWPYTMTWRFPWRLGRVSLPDGLAATAVVTATDAAGQTFVATGEVVVDVAPPAAVTPALTSGGAAVAGGSTLRAANAELTLSWPPSRDGSGLGPYLVQWAAQTAGDHTSILTAVDPSGPLAASYTAGEAQRLTVQVASQDIYGNLRWQGMGPVYVDGPRTPDYIQFDAAGNRVYDGWLEGGCSLLGADHRSEHAVAGRGSQRLYATWDAQALRLAWTGANWQADGDLFIYLDTGAVGADIAFTPYPPAEAGSTVALPGDMGADTLIWVQDGRTATLLHWDAGGWVIAARLSTEQYRYDPSRRGGQTDLYLPFEMLGIGNPAGSLGLLAFAAEEPAPEVGLRLWATAPAFNPANSSRANPLWALAGEGVDFGLSHVYRWPSLGAGICPNGSDGSQPGAYFADSDPQVTVSAQPAGGVMAGMGGGPFWLGDPVPAKSPTLHGLQAAYPAVDNGQELIYTVRYRNRGTQTAPGVRLALAAHGALRLLDETVVLGDIAPGEEVSTTFRAMVYRGQADGDLAAVNGLFYDAAHGPGGPALGWFWAVQRVDAGAPTALAIASPVGVVGVGRTLLTGYAYDESGVAQVQVEVQAPAGGTSLLTCAVPRPADGRWSCPWNVTGSNGGIPPADGSQFTLRVQASDTFGHRGWSDPQSLIVDARPPTVTLNTTGIQVFPGGVVHSQAVLVGTADDEHGVAGVEVCVDDQCAAADVQSSGAGPARWSIRRRSDTPLDYVTRTLSIYGTDTLGNRTPQPLSFVVILDDVPPAITVSEAITQVLLGSRERVLSGTVSDGGAATGMWVRAQAPDGETTSRAVAREGDTWWVDFPAGLAGRYQLAVIAEDRAGNQSTAGLFAVDVTCTAAGPVVAALAAEPAATAPFSLTLTAAISNTGPEALPAGMPVAFYVGQQLIETRATMQDLAPGAAQTISVTWAVDGSGNYDVSVRPNYPPAEAGVLCSTPAAAHQLVAVRDLPLHAGWNLVSPSVSPFNTETRVVQRPLAGYYRRILGYGGALLAYDPAGSPETNTLQRMDAGLGYWIDVLPAVASPPGSDVAPPAATLRLAGSVPPEDQPLPLVAGWNLAGYLPRQTLAITEALASIAGRYAGVFGSAGTALSYYPDLGPVYNTLFELAPDAGYWIRATQAITLQYPADVLTPAVPLASSDRPAQIRAAEQVAGARPSYEWMNFYGQATLPDAAPAPVGTVVLAVDPQGVICGATAVAYAGHYGLLACYGDDPTTPADEGALAGDPIGLFISADGIHATQLIGTGTWTAHGDRQMAPSQPSQPLYLPLICQQTEADARWRQQWLPLIVDTGVK